MTGKMSDAGPRRVSRPVMEFREDADHHIPGDHAGGATPVPIPNTEVKPSRADDTAAARLWESRALPGSFEAHGCESVGFSFAPVWTERHRDDAAHGTDEKGWSSDTQVCYSWRTNH